MALVRSVNVGAPAPNPHKSVRETGIGKRPVTGPVMVRDPGPRRGGLGSGLAGDFIGDRDHHGGADQAVYAFAREDLDGWQVVLGRELADGAFGENLTTTGIDVNAALIGERWQVGAELVLQVTAPRIPCATFRGWLGEPGWLRTFTRAARPGAYLRVIAPGPVAAGDPIRVVHRPTHTVSVTLLHRALTGAPEFYEEVLTAAADLPEELRRQADERRTIVPG